MNWLKENKIEIIIIYVNMMFTMKMMKLCYKIQGFSYVLVTLLFLLGVGIYCFFHVYLQKRKYKVLAVLVILAGFIVFCIFKSKLVIDYLTNTIAANFNTINDLLYTGRNTTFLLFKPFLITLLPLLTVIFMALYNRGISEAVLVLNLAVMLMFWYLEYVDEVKENIVMFIILSVLTYALNNYFKSVKDLTKKSIHNVLEGNKIISYILIFSLIVGWVGVIFPQEFEGKYSAETFKKWTNPFAPDSNGKLSAKARESKYALSSSGYSNTEKSLGGPIQINTDTVFLVAADKPYLLKGDVKDYYTGYSWKKTGESYKKSSDIKSVASNKYIDNLLKPVLEDVKKTISILPDNYNTSSMFVPINTISVKLQKGKVYYDTKGLTFTNSSKISNEYTVSFYDPDTVVRAVTDKLGNSNLEFNKSDYSRYLQVPANVTDRTKLLVQEVIRGARNDREKVEKIKNYLSSQYTYSTEVSQIPQGQEFLDYFLFQEKKGYCVYFATAMTMFCRIADVPARYVEGFKMPNNSLSGRYTVTNEEAHAWCEYLLKANPDIWAVADTAPTPSEDRLRNSQTSGAGGYTDPSTTPQVQTPPELNHKPEDLEEDQGITVSNSKSVPVGYIVSAAAVLVILVYILVRTVLFLRRRHKILNSKSCIPVYQHLQKRLSLVGFKKPDTVTDMEFAKDIWDRELRDKVVVLVDRVYDEFYGGKYDEKYNVKEMYITVENYVRKRQNELIYLIRKILI